MLALATSGTVHAQTSEMKEGSDIEKRSWAQLQDAGKAVLGQDEVISAKFVDDLLTEKLSSPTVKRKGITIVGGAITGALNLRNSKIDLPIVRLASDIKERVDISDSEFTGSLSFRGSRLPGGLTASRAIIGGSFQLGELDDTTWRSDWVADRGPTFPVIAFLKAPHLRLRGDFVIAGASIQRGIDLSNSDIGGSATLMHLVSNGVDQSSIDITATKIDNELFIFDCDIHRPKSSTAQQYSTLALYDIKTNQTLYVTRSIVDGDFDISDAMIAGDLNFRGSDFSEVIGHSMRISGSLMFGANTIEPIIYTRWHGPSIMDLTGTHVTAVRAPEITDAWPKHIHFEHFTTTSYSQEFCGGNGDNCPHSPTWYQNLLDRQAASRASYEPYKQIAEMLTGQGAVEEAARLSIRGHDVMREDALQHHEFLSYATMLFYGLTVGYGYHPEFAIIWAILFTVYGALIFRKTPEALQNHMPYGLAYSFDMLLPIVRLREKHYEIDLAGRERYYFYVHKLVGWVLGLLLAAVMTGLTTR